MSFRSILHSMLSQRLANLSALSTLRGRLAIVALSSVITHGALASDIVRVDTDSGSFVLEMYADTAPVTVANFLSYVNSGAYEGTIIHRKVNNFVIQGGGYAIDASAGNLQSIERQAPIVNEFNVSNTRGTIAMAKVPDQPNSATSEWFINLQDNSSRLDDQNEGYAVFGEVLGRGMNTIDSIGSLMTTTFGQFPELPYTKIEGNTLFLLTVSMRSMATSSKLDQAGVFSVTLDAGDLGQAWVDFTVIQNPEAPIIKLIPSSVLFIDKTLEKMATFNALSGELDIPELEVGGVVAYTNVVFKLTDAKNYSFTLQSFDEAP